MLQVGVSITEEKCHGCGHALGNRNITYRHDHYWHIACVKAIDDFTLAALKVAAEIGFTELNGEY